MIDPIAPDDAAIERAAHAAWRAYHIHYAGRDVFQPDEDGYAMEDTWPEYTALFPDADAFRACARAAIEAALTPTETGQITS